MIKLLSTRVISYGRRCFTSNRNSILHWYVCVRVAEGGGERKVEKPACCLTHTHQQTTPQTYRSHGSHHTKLYLCIRSHTHSVTLSVWSSWKRALFNSSIFIRFMASLILKWIYKPEKQVANHINDVAEANLTRTIQHVVWKKSFKSHDATLALGTMGVSNRKGSKMSVPPHDYTVSGKLLIMNETLWSLWTLKSNI